PRLVRRTSGPPKPTFVGGLQVRRTLKLKVDEAPGKNPQTEPWVSIKIIPNSPHDPDHGIMPLDMDLINNDFVDLPSRCLALHKGEKSDGCPWFMNCGVRRILSDFTNWGRRCIESDVDTA
ncbi:MAG: hypothetical protein KDB00_28925, partial [Planctomycetales bacterium]|nr:hypothetical protein [Planctomycetales bacterium]